MMHLPRVKSIDQLNDLLSVNGVPLNGRLLEGKLFQALVKIEVAS